MARKLKRPVPAPGDTVEVRRLNRRVRALVVEDRGPIGVDGRRLLRVRYGVTAAEPRETEVPADEVRLVRRGRPLVTRPEYS